MFLKSVWKVEIFPVKPKNKNKKGSGGILELFLVGMRRAGFSPSKQTTLSFCDNLWSFCRGLLRTMVVVHSKKKLPRRPNAKQASGQSDRASGVMQPSNSRSIPCPTCIWRQGATDLNHPEILDLTRSGPVRRKETRSSLQVLYQWASLLPKRRRASLRTLLNLHLLQKSACRRMKGDDGKTNEKQSYSSSQKWSKMAGRACRVTGAAAT